MRIQFEIQETLAGILDQLLHSDFWITEVEEVSSNKKIIRIRDFAYPQEAVAEVTDKEIILHTAWSKYTYRLYEVDGTCWCEYIGAYRGLLEQKLLPILTPKENFLDQYMDTKVRRPRRYDLKPQERKALLDLITSSKPDWDTLFAMFSGAGSYQANEFLASDAFLDDESNKKRN